MKNELMLVYESEIEHPMIEVGGVQKHRHNSAGQPIHHTDEGIKNFHSWFGDSKTVDNHGRPRVYYHGTDKDFDEFSPEKSKSSVVWGKGVYATEVKESAAGWRRGEGQNTKPLYIRSHNPMDIRSTMTQKDINTFTNHGIAPTSINDPSEKYHTFPLFKMERRHGSVSESASHMGYDSVLHHGPGVGESHILSLHSKDIKSALGNSGDFSPDSNKLNEDEHPMIEVGGVQKHRHNSNGNPIHPTDDGIKNFHNWFGDSKVVDNHGRPQVMYHGSVTKGVSEFDPEIIPIRPRTGPNGTYFTSKPEVAVNYTTKPVKFGEKRTGPIQRGEVHSAYLSIKNPLNITKDMKKLQKSGMTFGDAKRKSLEKLTDEHDGVVFDGNSLNSPEVIAMRKHQVKSANKNSGDFSPDSNKLNEDEAPAVSISNGVIDDSVVIPKKKIKTFVKFVKENYEAMDS